jgi:radical SAM protein
MRDFNDAPFLVIWELTQACDLACVHCRACAIPARNPLELSTEEGFRLLETVRAFGDPLMVFTGGDPLKRPDLFPLLQKSVSLGLRTTITPSATDLLNGEAIERFQQSGVARMAISLDGWDAASHDGFRRVEGSFDRTAFALEYARRIGLSSQINTTITRYNLGHIEQIAGLVRAFGAQLWSVFFLVATGRASASQDLTAEQYEGVFSFLYDLSKTARFDIKTTEAQHYRRYVAQSRKAEGAAGQRMTPPAEVIQRQAGINDGKGLVFVSITGEIYPSGFFPMSAGNVRRNSLTDVYRTSPLFQTLRQPDKLRGKCGDCEFRNLCGGSRSRSFALTGDYLSEDPKCVYQPTRTGRPRPTESATVVMPDSSLVPTPSIARTQSCLGRGLHHLI